MSFRAWPHNAVIDPAWERLKGPFLQLMCGEHFVYTPASGGQWLKAEEAIFDTIDKHDSELKQLLVTVLLQANQNVACLPDHVLEAVSVTQEMEITPSLVRKVLKNIPTGYRSLDRKHKLLLLKFVLNGQFTNVEELLGLELLPTSNQGFTSFSKYDRAIFICSREYPQELQLLPGLGNRFLDHDADEQLFRGLEAVAEKGMFITKLLDMTCGKLKE